MKDENHLKASPLGKQSSYVNIYTPALLFPIPRIAKREEIGILGDLPFIGADLWNAYEISWLNPKGKPQIAIGEILIPASSPNIIESKSFKLYLNSFNQTVFDSIEQVIDVMEKDLTKAAGQSVTVNLLPPKSFLNCQLGEFQGQCLDELDIEIHDFEISKDGLISEDKYVEESLYTNLLKSNCLVTGQPDWGSVCVSYKGNKIDPEGLLKYIVSFRNHNEFHEQCIERIFVDIMHHCKPAALTVYGRYTRRGGLDINPFRSTEFSSPPHNLRSPRQ